MTSSICGFVNKENRIFDVRSTAKSVQSSVCFLNNLVENEIMKVYAR